MEKRDKVVLLGALVTAIVAATILVPMVPLQAAILTSSVASKANIELVGFSVPTSGTSLMQDPSGQYVFIYLGNGTYITDLATYERLLQDPHSGIYGQVQIVSDTVTITVPKSPISTGPMIPISPGEAGSSLTAAARSLGLGSITFWLFGFGGTYVGGAYRLLLK